MYCRLPLHRLRKFTSYPTAVMLGVVVFICGTVGRADEIVISGNEYAVTVGDFDFYLSNSGGETPSTVVPNLSVNSDGEICAGELWKYFSQQGLDSVESLTICMDWESDSNSQEIDISDFRLVIEDPGQAGLSITDASLGNDSLVLPEFEVSNLKPEARLGVALGYDFMQRFSAESQAKIKLALGGSSQAGFMPKLSFEGTAAESESQHWVQVIGFIVLCVTGFGFLDRLTRPSQSVLSNNQETAHS